MTIREIIQQKAELLKDVDALGPAKASEELVSLSALLASVNKEVTDRNFAYNVLVKDTLAKENVAAKAKIIAQASKEWKDWMEAIGYQKATLDMIRALKYYLRRVEDEAREGKY